MIARVRPRRINGVSLDEHRMRVLAVLATFEHGSAAINGVMPGGTLAALAVMGLADKAGTDRLGDPIYRINDKGSATLASERGRK
jgi:hypothetical protein